MLITHHLWNALQKRGLSKSHPYLARFAREEDGVVTAMALFFVLMMCLVGGIGVDLMRNEMERTNVQATLDRAVLAAANLDQTLSPEGVVRDYFYKAGLTSFLNNGSVSVQDDVARRQVTAIARGTTNNMFMSAMGRTTLPVYGRSTAAQFVSNIEVSLVVDTSGSMRGRKMNNMRDAAKSFVDIILAPDQAETVSVSLVSYSGKVNAGSLINDYFAFAGYHNQSNCVLFSVNQFNIAGLDNSELPERVAHFDKDSNSETSTLSRPYCPPDDTNAIVPWSNNPGYLKTQIDALDTDEWTAIDAGMKWGVLLLDPSSQDELSAMATDGYVEPQFVGRPSQYIGAGDDNFATQKVVVLMTDGRITKQYDLKPEFKSGASDIFVALDPSGTLDPDANKQSVYDAGLDQYYWLEDKSWNPLPFGADGQSDFISQGLVKRVTNAELFGTRPIKNIVQVYYKDAEYLAIAGGQRGSEIDNASTEAISQDDGEDNLADICDVAKERGIVVFSVAFEAPEFAQESLQYCASTSSHYFDAEGDGLTEVFSAIARQVSQLKLTQ